MHPHARARRCGACRDRYGGATAPPPESRVSGSWDEACQWYAGRREYTRLTSRNSNSTMRGTHNFVPMTTAAHASVSLTTLLRLGRVSNLPTVWTNVLAGAVLAGGDWRSWRLGFVLLAMSLFYVGGMYLNDYFDR